MDIYRYTRVVGEYDDEYKRVSSFWKRTDKYATLETESLPWEEYITGREELGNALREQVGIFQPYLLPSPSPRI